MVYLIYALYDGYFLTVVLPTVWAVYLYIYIRCQEKHSP